MTLLHVPATTKPSRLFRRASVGAVCAMALFEVMHRLLHLDESISGVILGLALIPALLTGLLRQLATLLADPDRHLHTLAFAFANIAVTIVFFALVYLELGIYAPGDPGRREVSDFFTCLYFSTSTITTAGLGDFVPRPETRFIAALEMVFGYFAFGVVTAATFFLLVHTNGRVSGADDTRRVRRYRVRSATRQGVPRSPGT